MWSRAACAAGSENTQVGPTATSESTRVRLTARSQECICDVQQPVTADQSTHIGPTAAQSEELWESETER